MKRHYSISNKIALLLFTSFIIQNNSSFAVTLTPQQEQSLKSSEYNSGSFLSNLMKDLQRYKNESEAIGMKNLPKEEKEAKSVEAKPEAPDISITLNKLEIPDSEVLSREELDEISQEYSGKKVTIAELYQAIDKINALYAKKGYVTTVAILPPQKIENNVVKVQLIEGKIGQVSVENNKRTKTSYIKRFLNVPVGFVPNVEKLRRKIQKFNLTNKTILQIKMVAGEQPMTTDLYIVAVEPEKTRSTTIFSDNSGSENSGKYRYGLTYTDSNISGKCDIFNLSALFAKTSETAMFSYNTPIGYDGSRLTINHNSNKMRVNKGYMSDLDVRGESSNNSISFIKPLRTSFSLRSELVLDVQQQKSKTKILGNEFVRDTEKRYSIAYSETRIRGDSIYYFKPAYIYNQHKNIDGEHHNGDRLTLDAMWQKYLKRGDIVALRVSAQKDLDDYIPSADQYYLGGQYSVRGYHENVIGGDAGVNVKFDYSFKTKIKGLNFVTFFDWGRLNGDTLLTTKEIYSAGFGFDYQRGNLLLSVYTGYPLKDKIGDQKIDKSVTNFSLSYTF